MIIQLTDEVGDMAAVSHVSVIHKALHIKYKNSVHMVLTSNGDSCFIFLA
jgi:hypothetical protein